jgi:RNA polymerase sigma-70 factor (ECF subfamily)
MELKMKTPFEAERPALLTYVLSIVRNADTAEDLTQEAMLKAHRNISGLKNHTSLTPWLYRIAINVCRDHFRKKMTTRQEIQGIDFDSLYSNDMRDENAPKLNKVMECAEMSECVQRYFNELSDSYRAVMCLHDIEGMKNQEIADMLKLSLATVKIRLHRARKKLRTILDGVCHFYIDERGIWVCEPKHELGG